MSKRLVAYFSATGVTEKTARMLAKAAEADLFEIEPEVKYTKADLNWMDKKSRSSVEMNDKSSRPAVKSVCPNMADYDTVFVGFPIWWYIAPTVINTFLEAHDMRGKTVVPFATSGGSGMGRTNEFLKPSVPESRLLEGRVLNRAKEADLVSWVESLGI